MGPLPLPQHQGQGTASCFVCMSNLSRSNCSVTWNDSTSYTLFAGWACGCPPPPPTSKTRCCLLLCVYVKLEPLQLCSISASYTLCLVSRILSRSLAVFAITSTGTFLTLCARSDIPQPALTGPIFFLSEQAISSAPSSGSR